MTDVRGGAAGPGAIDIGALLRVALEQAPRDEVQDRVMDRMTLATTVMEFARLMFVAPVHWLLATDAGGEEGGDDDGE